MYVDHLALVLNARLKGEHGSFRQAYSSFDQVYLLVRRVSAGFGTATIPAIYFAAAPLGTATALGASALMAAATLHVRESKYATTDAGAVFWITLCLAMIVRIALKGKGRYYLAAGLLAGFATATKYPAGVLIPAIAVAHLEARLREGRSLWRSFRDIRIFVAGFGAIVAFVCGTPYFFLDWTQTVGDYKYQRGFVVDGLANPQTTYGVRWLFFHAAPESFGIVMMALFLAAMIWMALRPRLATYPLLAFVLVACVSMTRSHYVFYRYLVFPLPALILLAAAFLADLTGLATPRLGRGAAGAALCGALGLLVLPSLLRDIELDRLLLQPDSRVIAREWIEHNIPPGSRIAVTDMGNQCGKPRLPPYYQLVPIGPVEALRAHQVQLGAVGLPAADSFLFERTLAVAGGRSREERKTGPGSQSDHAGERPAGLRSQRRLLCSDRKNLEHGPGRSDNPNLAPGLSASLYLSGNHPDRPGDLRAEGPAARSTGAPAGARDGRDGHLHGQFVRPAPTSCRRHAARRIGIGSDRSSAGRCHNYHGAGAGSAGNGEPAGRRQMRDRRGENLRCLRTVGSRRERFHERIGRARSRRQRLHNCHGRAWSRRGRFQDRLDPDSGRPCDRRPMPVRRSRRRSGFGRGAGHAA